MTSRCRYFRSCEKDGSHIIRPAVAENPMLHANITVLCFIEWELLSIGVLHCGNRNFRPFWLLWRWLDDLHLRTWPVFSGDIPHVRIWTYYFKAFESCRLFVCLSICVCLYRSTDNQDQNYIPRRFAGGQLRAVFERIFNLMRISANDPLISATPTESISAATHCINRLSKPITSRVSVNARRVWKDREQALFNASWPWPHFVNASVNSNNATNQTRSLAIAKRPCDCCIILKSRSYTKAI